MCQYIMMHPNEMYNGGYSSVPTSLFPEMTEVAKFLVKVLVCLLVIFFARQRWKMRRVYELSKKLENSYRALPLIGHAYMAFGTNEDRMNVVKKFSVEAMKSKHGVTGAWIGMRFYVVVSDAKAAEVLTKAVLEKSSMKTLRHLTGNGSVFAPIGIWRKRRKVVAPSFCEKRLQIFTEVFGRQSLAIIPKLEALADTGTFSAWQPLIEYTMSSVCEAAFGMHMDSRDYTVFLKAFQDYSAQSAVRISQPWLRSDIVLKSLPLYEKLEKNKQIIWNFLNQVIQQKYNNNKDGTEAPTNIMEMLVETSQRRQQPFSEEELREELIVVLLAGTDTSTVATCFTCLMLAKHPEVQERVYKEIVEVMGNLEKATTLELSKMKYLDAVIRETLRLFPPVPIIARKVENDVVLPTGITIVQDCELLISAWGIHRNPQLWGKDAEEFNPDRFLSPIPSSSYFMAFGHGPRNCTGYRFAMLSAKMIISTILRNFRIISPKPSQDPSEPMKLKYHIMLKDVNNYKIQLLRRKNV